MSCRAGPDDWGRNNARVMLALLAVRGEAVRGDKARRWQPTALLGGCAGWRVRRLRLRQIHGAARET